MDKQVIKIQEHYCCLCNKPANLMVEHKTFVEHRCVSVEYKFYCSEHYIQYKEKDTQKQLNNGVSHITLSSIV